MKPATHPTPSAHDAAPGQDTHLLQSQLAAYVAGELYPLHMPGHKRQLAPVPGLPYGWDVTEVPGTDDLHDAHGILAEAMARTARLFGAARSFYLVGGSTVGLLAGIRALAPAGSTVIAARNCHKAVYHAIELGNLQARWLLPPVVPGWQVYGSITPAAVEEALCAEPKKPACVIVTSPTYEGVLSDIAGIAAVCHSHGVPLLVDEAHGAHLGLFAESETGFPAGAVHCGADVVVQSAHKTLPSLTQTALLHLPQGSMADAEEIQRQLDVFETSSPSYPLLASLDGCTGLLQKDGLTLLRQWYSLLQELDTDFCRLTRLQVLCHGNTAADAYPDIFAFDTGKLCVRDAGGVGGAALAERLRRQYGFETEMACGGNLLAMTSLADAPEALRRFGRALADLDAGLPPVSPDATRRAVPLLPPPGTARCSIGQAVAAPAQVLPAAEAAGRLCGEYIWAYPPGVPLIAPGEEITPAFLQAATALRATGTALHHTGGSPEACLRVLL